MKKILVVCIKFINVVIAVLLCAALLFGCGLAAVLLILHAVNYFVRYPMKNKIAWLLAVASILFLIVPGTVIVKEPGLKSGVKLLPIVYGYPSEGLMKEAKKDNVILGGSRLMPINPVWAVVIFKGNGDGH